MNLTDMVNKAKKKGYCFPEEKKEKVILKPWQDNIPSEIQEEANTRGPQQAQPKEKSNANNKSSKNKSLSKRKQSMSNTLAEHGKLPPNSIEKKISKPSQSQTETKFKLGTKQVQEAETKLETDWKQSVNEADLNGAQFADKRNTEPDTNGTQNLTQTEHKRNTNGTRFADKRNTEPDTNGTQNLTQTEHKRNTNGTRFCDKANLPSLIGNQRKITLALFKSCIENGEHITQPMTIDHLSELSSVNKYSIKTTIARLKKKGYIECAEYQDGRGGWIKYRLKKELYTELLRHTNGTQMEHKWNTNGTQFADKRNTKPDTEPDTNTPSSSSDINKTTTTKLPDEWSEIDYSSIANLGFTKKHLRQWWERKLCSAEEAQESIHHFAFDLQSNQKKFKTSPVNALMGIMAKSRYYNAPDHYQSPKEMAIERRKARIEQKKKKLEELKRLEKYNWLEDLSGEARETLLPNEIKQSKLKGERDAFLSGYFEEHIWPGIKKSYN